MRRRDKITLLGILILTVFALLALAWRPLEKSLHRERFQLGLDLRGGAHLVYEADLSQAENPEEAMKGVINVIERRINAYGVSEPVIQKIGENRLLVQLPGIEKIEEAKKLIGQTALINFKELKPDENGDLKFDSEGRLVRVKKGEGDYIAIPATAKINGEEKELTSKYFKGNTMVVLNQMTNQPEIAFEWNEEGAKLFEQITKRLLHKPLGIFLGDEPISAPTVQAVIRDRGVITGLDLDRARWLSSLLNAGRIPVPLHTIEEHDVSPTLGADFIKRGLIAGIIGLALIILFMILYYRLPGLMAGFALLIYTALVLAAFKLIPVTLTLAGIAGFILSVGMAVDANVLIFERMKEELRMGRTVRAAVETGFDRAWPAIRDSNVSTFIACGILYWMGSSLATPPVMGFAVTLFIGVAISMFTAIVVTRTFLRVLGTTGAVRRLSLFIPVTPELVSSKGGA